MPLLYSKRDCRLFLWSRKNETDSWSNRGQHTARIWSQHLSSAQGDERQRLFRRRTGRNRVSDLRLNVKQIQPRRRHHCLHLKQTQNKLKTYKEETIMSENQNNQIPAQPVYIMQPQQQGDTSIFNGLGGVVLSALAGLLLGQFGGGIGFPRFPKLWQQKKRLRNRSHVPKWTWLLNWASRINLIP